MFYRVYSHVLVIWICTVILFWQSFLFFISFWIFSNSHMEYKVIESFSIYKIVKMYIGKWELLALFYDAHSAVQPFNTVVQGGIRSRRPVMKVWFMPLDERWLSSVSTFFSPCFFFFLLEKRSGIAKSQRSPAICSLN